MPAEGLQWLAREDVLTFEEMERVARVCVTRFGVEGIRITGGEPTVRAQLAVLVAKLAGLQIGGPSGPRPVDIAMTTNGATLAGMAHDLRRAGLNRINISLDSLHPDCFEELTRRPQLDRVLAGIDAAIDAGFDPVKVNAVLIRGVNDGEVVDFARFGRERGVQIRFIEFMPLDAGGGWTMDQVVPSDEVIASIDEVFPLEPVSHGPEPATRFRYRDGAGEIGVIPSVTRPFCGDCDRIRITAEGQLRNCLFAVTETDLRAIMRSGGDDEELAAAISGDVAGKWAGHSIGKVNFTRPARSMSQIGG
jgi:cyclic pyranopterin phosphate synthase